MGLLPGFGNGNDTRVCYPRQPPLNEGREFALASGILVISSAVIGFRMTEVSVIETTVPASNDYEQSGKA